MVETFYNNTDNLEEYLDLSDTLKWLRLSD